MGNAMRAAVSWLVLLIPFGLLAIFWTILRLRGVPIRRRPSASRKRRFVADAVATLIVPGSVGVAFALEAVTGSLAVAVCGIFATVAVLITTSYWIERGAPGD